MRTIILAGGGVLKVHDALCDENTKFITGITNTEKAQKEYEKIPKGEGLVVFRARNDFPCNDSLLAQKIIDGKGCKDFFRNERPDIDASPTCVELIIIK